MKASVTYRLTDEPVLEILMEAVTDRPTVINLVHHGYWNLAGHGAGGIRSQHLLIEADHYTPVGPGKIPTGEVAPVAGTAFDFRTIRPIGAHIDDISQVPEAGYDHNFCLNGERGVLRRAARAIDPHSGRGLEIWTDQPGVQFYTANHFGTLPAMGKGAFLTVSMPVSRSRHRPTRIHRTSRISPRLCSGRARLIASHACSVLHCLTLPLGSPPLRRPCRRILRSFGSCFRLRLMSFYRTESLLIIGRRSVVVVPAGQISAPTVAGVSSGRMNLSVVPLPSRLLI